ncbi:uncharacterized protein LOC119666190 [Teleopsis dalmanni]|uniref:uncharacterized protein LOC119666190 n=1 Tax=Teleopsis dalmanni TaxID=139649 RepID=UPI0018CD158B|nr:uncharacterized protein LOC119666190 [Teleopsis dalmanni]
MLTKLKELRIKDLNVIVNANGIRVVGSKQTKIAELEKVLGSDEIDTEDYDLDKSEESVSMAKQFEELKDIVMNLTQTVHAMTMQQPEEVTQRQESLAEAAVTGVRTEAISSPVSTAITRADTVQGNSIVKDVVGVLPEFDPIKGCITSEQFITKIEQLQRHKMKGVAKEWLDAQPVFETWQEFVRALSQDFSSLINSADAHREMMRRKRKYNETLTEYFYSMLAMGRRANMDEPSINSYIINGLNQPESTRALLAINVRSCSELLQSIQNMKSAQSVPQHFNFPTAKSADINYNNEIAKGPKCYNCNQMGHIAIKCTAPQRKLRCTKCLKIGHEEKNCKTKGSSISQVYEEKTNAYPPILRKIKIGSSEVLAFVDTGSDNTLIKDSSVPKDLFTSIQVVPDEFLVYPVLLGRDVISHNNNLIKTETETQVGVSVNRQHFDISADINGTQRKQVSALLKQFESCFAEDLSNIGRCKTAEMKIEASFTKPILGKRTSPHAASALLVPKANGENRLCIDYRALNAVTVKKQYPMPIVEEQLAKLAGNKYFTTFYDPDGLFEYNVMPFGLVNAPMVFQEVVSNIIRGLENQHKIISYVDEVIIASTSVDEGLTILKEFLNAMASAGLTLRPSKCSFMQTKVKFLGHVINNAGIQPGTEKTRCIDEYPQPRNETEVRRFLGVTGFFRKFVKQYSLIAQPLSKFLKKNHQFIWEEEQNNAFKLLKAAITSQPVLTLYDPTKYHEVHTDASATGIAAVLFQREQESLRPAFYYSRLCSDAENRYSSHELEVLAITEALERFRIYLLGAKFLVVTDCNAVATLKASTALIPRVAR